MTLNRTRTHHLQPQFLRHTVPLLSISSISQPHAGTTDDMMIAGVPFHRRNTVLVMETAMPLAGGHTPMSHARTRRRIGLFHPSICALSTESFEFRTPWRKRTNEVANWRLLTGAFDPLSSSTDCAGAGGNDGLQFHGNRDHQVCLPFFSLHFCVSGRHMLLHDCKQLFAHTSVFVSVTSWYKRLVTTAGSLQDRSMCDNQVVNPRTDGATGGEQRDAQRVGNGKLFVVAAVCRWNSKCSLCTASNGSDPMVRPRKPTKAGACCALAPQKGNPHLRLVVYNTHSGSDDSR